MIRTYFILIYPAGINKISNLLVDDAMRRSNGNQTLAARLLGISQRALNKRLKKRSE